MKKSLLYIASLGLVFGLSLQVIAADAVAPVAGSLEQLPSESGSAAVAEADVSVGKLKTEENELKNDEKAAETIDHLLGKTGGKKAKKAKAVKSSHHKKRHRKHLDHHGKRHHHHHWHKKDNDATADLNHKAWLATEELQKKHNVAVPQECKDLPAPVVVDDVAAAEKVAVNNNKLTEASVDNK